MTGSHEVRGSIPLGSTNSTANTANTAHIDVFTARNFGRCQIENGIAESRF